MSKQFVVKQLSHDSQAQPNTRLDRRWTETLNLQAWRNLMEKTWSQYFKYIFCNNHMKIAGTNNLRGQLAWEAAEYQYSTRMESVNTSTTDI
jgi:hypothetical protein